MPEAGKIPVAIAACGVISAVGCGTESLVNALLSNTSGLREEKRFSSERFPSGKVGAAPRLGENFDADPAYALADEALAQTVLAGRTILEMVPLARRGLVLSTTKANLAALEHRMDQKPVSEPALRHLQANLLALDLAEAHQVKGPVQSVSVACVSGLVAIQQGAKFIQRGAADAVFVVGVDHLSAFVIAGFTALKALDPRGARPFDQHRAGLSPGEAGACVLLARGDYVSTPLAWVSGWATTNDANHLTGPSRDGAGLSAAMESALKSANVSADEIDYVNAHGTGTLFNDAMESHALRRVFGDAIPPVSGFKGMLGHTLGASGVVETIACVLAMQNNFLPGTVGLTTPAEGSPRSLLLAPDRNRPSRHVLKLNVGFGGINGALVLSHA